MYSVHALRVIIPILCLSGLVYATSSNENYAQPCNLLKQCPMMNPITIGLIVQPVDDSSVCNIDIKTLIDGMQNTTIYCVCPLYHAFPHN